MEPMTPVMPHSNEREIVYAKDQPECLPLPAVNRLYGDGVRTVITRWRLTWRERIKVLFRGCVWLEQMTFGGPLQPQRPTVDEPLVE
jgi:hypothetical protein